MALRRRHDPAAGLGDLEAALTGEGCPVCARAAGADERWLDRFLDDGYLERDLMRRIAAAAGSAPTMPAASRRSGRARPSR